MIPATEKIKARSASKAVTAEATIKPGVKTRTIRIDGGAMGHISLYGSATFADAIEALTALDAELQKAVDA